ncbi:MAG: DUF2314 domain-containing protein [Pseudomonadota bacterium]
MSLLPRMSSKVILCLVLLTAACAPPQDTALYSIDPSAPDVQAMQREVARTLPRFLDEAIAGDPVRYANPAVKVALPTASDTIEVIWIQPVRRATANRYVGALANTPVDLGLLQYGDEVSFGANQIADWSFFRNGQLYGNFQDRTAMQGLPADVRAELSALLSPDPIPPEWR